VNTKDFESLKTLKISPPDGEFVVMNYRINSEFQPPFRIYPAIEEASNYKLQLRVKIKATFPQEQYAYQTLVKFVVPRQTVSINLELNKVHFEYKIDTCRTRGCI
jgi:AP-4 complex subunit mu-1